MSEAITRKCACCKEAITIDKNSIDDVLQYKGKYYHLSCFEVMATEKAASKRGKPVEWQTALDNLQELKNETKNMIEYIWAKDDLNDWLLKHYDISAVPSRFWQMIAELEQGKYKGKKCKPIKISTILGTWQWGQQKLNAISVNNKKNHKGPKDDNARLSYDLSIVISKVPNYFAHLSKVKALEAETKQTTVKTKINYDSLERQANTNQIDDISDLLDEIF